MNDNDIFRAQALKEQDNRCAICGKSESAERQSLCLDHDHLTGKNRGMLCDMCNKGIGCFGDDTRKLRNAIVYLERFIPKRPRGRPLKTRFEMLQEHYGRNFQLEEEVRHFYRKTQFDLQKTIEAFGLVEWKVKEIVADIDRARELLKDWKVS